jgi:hypothetical protein
VSERRSVKNIQAFAAEIADGWKKLERTLKPGARLLKHLAFKLGWPSKMENA